ncbi:hypothetical protein ACIHFC_23685 [Streptomyces sp. NPDC052013]|uniref:hypothetical protein n=1 Tax=Streptomyces sp. NPDC052013 TaxID=3365679 RepID=UPI0037D81060
MDIAQHIALIDELCFRPFPAEHGPSDVGFSGPGHHVAVLRAGHPLHDGDPGDWAVTADQYEKERDAVHEVLAARWGEADLWNLQTVLLRTEAEEIPEPWARLAACARTAWLWQVPGTGRWAAVAVADQDPAGGVQLLAVVTETAPP